MMADLYGSAGTIAVGTIGILVALRNQRRQLHTQMYIELSKGFQEMLRSFPAEAWLANANPSRPMPPPSREVTESTLYALQFVANVYYVHKGGYLSADLWKLWERAISKTLAGRIFQREWETLSAEFVYSQDFVNYIDTTIHPTHERHTSRGV